MTQIRHNGPGEAYYRKPRDAGDSHAEALRRIERRIARSVFGHLRTDHINRTSTSENIRSFPESEQVGTARAGLQTTSSPLTVQHVQTHLTHVYTKLGLTSRVQLAKEAARHASAT